MQKGPGIVTRLKNFPDLSHTDTASATGLSTHRSKNSLPTAAKEVFLHIFIVMFFMSSNSRIKENNQELLHSFGDCISSDTNKNSCTHYLEYSKIFSHKINVCAEP